MKRISFRQFIIERSLQDVEQDLITDLLGTKNTKAVSITDEMMDTAKLIGVKQIKMASGANVEIKLYQSGPRYGSLKFVNVIEPGKKTQYFSVK